jgi:8-oxo-dGTP diphosphatase
MPDFHEFPRPSLSVDLVVLYQPATPATPATTEILLIQRKNPPFAQCWALPGGFMDINETLEQAAVRELAEETGVPVSNLTQIHTFSAVDRDPRGRVVSVGFLVELSEKVPPMAGDDAQQARWFPLEQLPEIAFDHRSIIEHALKRRGNFSVDR